MPISKFQASTYCVNSRLEDPIRLEAARYVRDHLEIVNGRTRQRLSIPASSVFSTILKLSDHYDEKIAAASTILELRSYSRGDVLYAAEYLLEHSPQGSHAYDLACQRVVATSDSDSELVLQATRYLYETAIEGTSTVDDDDDRMEGAEGATSADQDFIQVPPSDMSAPTPESAGGHNQEPVADCERVSRYERPPVV